MNPKSSPRSLIHFGSTFLLSVTVIQAAPYYWDTNGSTAGAGGAIPSGSWTTGGTTWSTSPNGTVATPGYTTLTTDDLFFSAGVGATGSPIIALTSAQDAGSLSFQEGTTTISGASGIINLSGTGGKITVNNGAAAIIGATTDTIIGGSVGLTKIGVGTLTLNGSLAHTFTGGLNVNGGTLALNYANMATPTDLINNGNALGLGGGRLLITGKTGAFTTDQTLGNVTVNSGGGSILGDKNGGTALNINLGTLTTTASGGSLLVGAGGTAANAPVITTTSGTLTNGIYSGRAVFFDGTPNTGYDWLTTVSTGTPYTLSGLAAGGYTALNLTAGTDTNNSTISANATMTGSRNTNSLKFAAPATAQTLTIGAGNTLTLGSGGLLFTGAAVAQGPRIAGGTITAGNGSGSYDLVVHAYNATNLSVAANGAAAATNNTAINSIIADNGGNAVTLVKNGPSPLLLGGANTFTGGIIVNQGDLQAGVATALNNNAITFNANSNFITTGITTSNGVITLNNNAQVTFVNNNTSFTSSGKVTGTGGISIERGGLGSNTVNLTATTHDFTGPIRFIHSQANQSANLTVNSLADTTTIGEGNITFGAAASNINGTANSHNFSLGTAAVAVTLNNRQFELATTNPIQTINNNGANAFTINSNLLVSSTTGKVLTFGGTGSGLSTFAGTIANNAAPTTGTTIQAAQKGNLATTITLASVEGIQVGDPISGTNITAGTTVLAVNPITKVVTLSAASGATQNAGITITTPNVVNSVSVAKSGTGTWVLGGSNTFTGTTNITAGALNVQNINALGATSGGTLVSNAATLQLQGGFSYAAEPLTLTPGGGGSAMLLNVSGTNTWNGPITSNTATSTNVSRIQSDLGTMTLAGTLTASGSAHQLVFQGNGAITVSGQVTGVGRVTSGSNGTGVRTLSNDTNNYTGATSANGGTLEFTSIGNVGATSSALGAPALADATIQLAAAVANPGTLRYVGTAPGGHTSDRVINLLATTGPNTIEANGAGPLVLTASNTATGAGIKTLTLSGTNTGNNSIGAIVDNSLVNTTSLTKSGTGKWVMTGTSSYTGTTTVSSGVLAVNGSLANTTTTVGSSGTLQGNGSIAGSVTVQSGGTLAPGNSIESLTTGALTMDAGSTFAYEVADNTATGADLLASSGTISLTTVTLSLDAATLAALGGGGWSIGNKLTLISYLDPGSGITSGFTGYVDDTSYFFGLNEWMFNYNDTVAGGNYGADAIAASQNRFVTMTLVPEPGTALLGGLGLLALLRRRRR